MIRLDSEVVDRIIIKSGNNLEASDLVKWVMETVDSRFAADLAREVEVSPILAKMLIRRGLSEPEAVQAFLQPSLRDLPSPFLLPDLDLAVERLIQALAEKQMITVYGDYDADGLTATALLADFLKGLGARVSTYVPHRTMEGYGLNIEALEGLARSGTRLLVTVDCGVADFEALTRARELGLEVIVTDHHQPPNRRPPALAVVNPKLSGSKFPQRNLAGVGVAFFLAGGLRQALRERGLFSKADQPELTPYLELAAIGTVADVVPLTKVNRILVSMGLRTLTAPYRPGLAALKEVSALTPDKPVTARDVAFRLAPRLNAAGRLDSPLPGLELLMTRDPALALAKAVILEDANRERRRLQKKMIGEAMDLLEDQGPESAKAIVLGREGWHRGLVGVAASKIVEKYYRPAILLSLEDGRANGSGRSIPGFNLYSALDRCRDLMVRFGGHEQAAGLTLEADQVSSLARALDEIAAGELSEDDLVPSLRVEAEVTIEGLTQGLAVELGRLEPFGQGNPEPIFAVNGAAILSGGVVGGRHLKLMLSQGGRTLDTIGFNLGHLLPDLGRHVSVALQRHASTYQGRTTLGWKAVDIIKGKVK
ncbi:MAG: single-stranded-DNA-specific exonuclease RecJ [Thermodesulfobacteriota bacterium]|nr:single-stranded-DNA-specific exonuclease RecJ [Thermodesulfobacteriota bacterium]